MAVAAALVAPSWSWWGSAREEVEQVTPRWGGRGGPSPRGAGTPERVGIGRLPSFPAATDTRDPSQTVSSDTLALWGASSFGYRHTCAQGRRSVLRRFRSPIPMHFVHPVARS